MFFCMNFVLILPSFLGRDKKEEKRWNREELGPYHPRYTARKKNYKKNIVPKY